MRKNNYLIPFFGVFGSIITLVIFKLYFLENDSQFGAVAIDTNKWMIILFAYLVTLFGVTLGSVYRNLQERKKSGQTQLSSIPIFFKNVFMSIDFWSGVCASPLVLLLIYNSIGNSSISSLFVISFENGFFVTLVVEKAIKGISSTNNLDE